MKRNSFGMSHKLKTDIPIGVHVPVLSKELIPGDIVRIKPEVLLKAVVPPVTQLTDKFKYTLEGYFTPDRLTDDGFVRNMSTTKTGEVKGNFKSFSIDSLCKFFGDSVVRNYPSVSGIGLSNTPTNFPYAISSDCFGNPEFSDSRPSMFSGEHVLTKTSWGDYNFIGYNSIFPVVSEDRYDSAKDEHYGITGTEWFGQNSLMDYLNCSPVKNFGLGYKGSIRTNHISTYYMIMNFYHTNPEYQKYLAPDWDYDYGWADGVNQSDFRFGHEMKHSLHRYESLEEEFGNGFVQPRNSGRCWRGLCIANWGDNYFTKTTIDAQRGIAPEVPVSIKGSSTIKDNRVKLYNEMTGEHVARGDSPVFGGSNPPIWTAKTGTVDNGKYDYVIANSNYPVNFMMGLEPDVDSSQLTSSFVISDLRTALALQHFQEDAQGTYKWTDFLLRMFGTSPVDSLQDKPYYIGGFTGRMVANEVLQTATTSEGDLGDIGGRMSSYETGKQITFNAKEHGVLMFILTIKPERNFQSGIDRQFTRLNYLDSFFKQFVGIGAQAIRADEITTQNYGVEGDSRKKNWGFTDRFEELKHEHNKITGGCRSVNGSVGIHAVYKDGNWSYRSDTLRDIQSSELGQGLLRFGMPNLDKHMFAIGDSYSFFNSELSSLNYINGSEQFYNENCGRFLLCIPQLTDVFVSDRDIPFLCTIGWNMDIFRPVPVYTKPGVQYV